jgi:hypothetical protein
MKCIVAGMKVSVIVECLLRQIAVCNTRQKCNIVAIGE